MLKELLTAEQVFLGLPDQWLLLEGPRQLCSQCAHGVLVIEDEPLFLGLPTGEGDFVLLCPECAREIAEPLYVLYVSMYAAHARP